MSFIQVHTQWAVTAREVQRLINQPELPHLTYTIFNIFNEAMQTFTFKSFYCLEPLKVLFLFLSLHNLIRVHGSELLSRVGKNYPFLDTYPTEHDPSKFTQNALFGLKKPIKRQSD